MKIKQKIYKCSIITALFFLIGILCGFPMFQADAAVTGVCSNCHTMHNSQNGNSINVAGPMGNLLSIPSGSASTVDACVGCHSSTTSNTIINNVPIVYNTIAPTAPLAGGNFYWVASQGDEFGHNVYGISGQDPNHLNGAPGNENCGGLTTPCHKTLAVAPSSENYNRGGCRGCHFNVFHHNDNGIYRFLSTGHETGGSAAYYVEGGEDSDWEQTTATHNWYKGVVGPVNAETLATTHSISTFCGGCHKDFHRQDFIGGTSSPWKRHPTDIALPSTGEYAAYDPVNNYDLDVPVAWTTPTTVSKGTAIVMCLSCHRAHGSDQPDMLRWNYTNDCFISTGSANCGCFTCHSTKN
ncbi:doubled CXXCH motif [bacterium BMS3Abin09]|nr:doubled CXXCH motif [bacterium BMS3Abin09]